MLPKAPKPELEGVANAPKGDLSELAKADKPDDANAEGEVVRPRSPSSAADISGFFEPNGDFVDAKFPKGDVVDVFPSPPDSFA